MAAAKKTTAVNIVPPPLWQTVAFLFGPARTFTFAVIILAAFTGGAWALWQRVEKHVASSRDYLVTVDQIAITPPPDWISSDIRAEAFRNAGSSDRPLSILDDNLAERIHMAFMLHPWVNKATVAKLAGARVRVEIEYRRPACMVELAGGQPTDLLPVDGQGILLPGDDFSQKQKESYPILTGIDRRPIQPVGHPWGDPRVVDGAAIASALVPAWHPLKLYRLQCVSSATAAGRPTFELCTRAGTRILWGCAAGVTAGEPSIEEKIARLQQYAAAHGGLDAGSSFDIRKLPAAKTRS